MTLQSCDPDPCSDVACANGGECFDGTCICPDGFGGSNCETDLCADVTCLNGGTCVNGDCECPAGYSGTDCGIEQRSYFILEYNASEACTSGDDPAFLMEIKATAQGADKILIENIYNLTSPAWAVPLTIAEATITGTITSDTSFDILEQNLSGNGNLISVLGSGSIDPGTGIVTLIYTITDSNVTPAFVDDCTTTLSPR